jgi:hypothetical protein
VVSRGAEGLRGVVCDSYRHAGRAARCNIPANSRKLTDLEERTLVRYITDLSSHAFPPSLRGVEDMANQLLQARGAPYVGKYGLTTSLNASQSSGRVLLADMITRGLNAKIRRLFPNGLPSYRT